MQTSQGFCGGMLRGVPSGAELSDARAEIDQHARQVPPAIACTTPDA